ncbi:traB domain-containing protein-like isoform 2 [Hibiscus syriacus]|uniref:TraB domain-containing protein-like isoform 2 n=1 Tax=Hibiscus syriacus TaxID=106335 RepID=A0A6A2Z8A7_HIBSY|nr:traB domain-containing protein-like isoform 2 [Hibiscus syriacus]
MESMPTESDHPSSEDFVHIDNTNPNVPDALSDSIVNVEKEEEEEGEEDNEEEIQNEGYDGNNDYDVSTQDRSGSSEGRELPEELLRSVMVLSCESSADGGDCDVYLVGTAHESCREVEAVISCLKPQVVFLELCSSRVVVLTPQNLKVPTMGDMIDIWFLAKVASRLEVFPGSEFRVAFEEAMKYGGKVILGDRPVQVTLCRTWGKMPLWHKIKLLHSLLFQAVFLPSPDELNKMLKDMDDVDMLTLVIQEMSKEFPTLMETLVHERDQFMSSMLLRTVSEHSSVVAVVGKGHLQGIKKYRKQPVLMDDLMTIPSQKQTVSTCKILVSLGIAVAGVAIVSGIHLAGKK